MALPHELERQVKGMLDQLKKVESIDPRAFDKVRNDVEHLHRHLSANAEEFKSTTSDIKTLRKNLADANNSINVMASRFRGDAKRWVALKTLTDFTTKTQKELGHYMSRNTVALKLNDAAHREQERELRKEMAERKKLAQARHKVESEYVKKTNLMNAERDRLQSIISRNVGSLNSQEIKDYDRQASIADDGRKSLVRRRSASIGANIIADIPKNILSKARIRTVNPKVSEEGDLYQQLNDIRTFQATNKVRSLRDEITDVTDSRSKSPLRRMYDAFEKESRSPQSRVILLNIYRNSLIAPLKAILKTTKSLFENAFIKALNFPINSLKWIKDMLGDGVVRLFGGKEALQNRVDTRNALKEEESIEKEEALNERLGIGLERLADLLEQYTSLITRPGIDDLSSQASLNQIAQIEEEISDTNKRRELEELLIDVPQQELLREHVDDIKVSPVNSSNMSQEVEQRLEDESETREKQADDIEVMKETLLDMKDGVSGDSSKDEGFFGKIANMLGIKSLLNSLKGFGPKLLSILGLSGAGALLGSGKGLLGLAARVAPWAAALYSIAKAFKETVDEFEDQGSVVLNVMEGFRLFTQNLVTVIPELLDKLMGSLFGFKTNLKGFVDDLFEKLNKLGEWLGRKAYDVVESVKKTFTNLIKGIFGESEEEKDARIKQTAESNVNMFFKEVEAGREARNKALDSLAAPSNIQYKPSGNRDPFSRDDTSIPVQPATPSTQDMSSVPIRVTSFNNPNHKHRKGSLHYENRALDLTPVGFGGMPYTGRSLQEENPEAYQAYERTATLLKNMGLKVVDEYSKGRKVSKHGSARHIHVEGTEDQIRDVLNRADVVKPGAVTPAESLKDRKTTQMLSSSKQKITNTIRHSQTEKPPAPSQSPPISFNVPQPKVIVTKDLDGSFAGWKAISDMHA